MQGDPARGSVGIGSHASDEWANEEANLAPSGKLISIGQAKERLARLARTIESDVIPRLVQAHRPQLPLPSQLPLPAAPAAPSDAESAAFIDQLIRDSDSLVFSTVSKLRERGVSVESVYLDLFAPAARRLGEMWDSDDCDFSTVTVALGRLQRLLRELSPAFGTEIGHPANGRRALFVQPRDEQHSFGLSMVAEFFRRDGWDVIGGVGGAVAHPSLKVQEEWVDVIGFSVGSDLRLPWLRDTIAAVRSASRNARLGVLVGGPPFVANPALALAVGADATARNGKEAPSVAERLLSVVRLHR